MNTSGARIIVVTRDAGFFAKIRQPLANDRVCSLIINVSAIGDAENKLVPNGSNVLILDADNVQGTPVQVDHLQRKYLLLVILTGQNQARAASLSKESDFLTKPLVGNGISFVNNILVKIRSFVLRKDMPASNPIRDMRELADSSTKIVLVASSTGGTDAFEKIIKTLPADCPPILIVQHMPSGFTKLYSERLNNFYPMTITEARTGDYVKRGHILMAPADQHMSLAKMGDRYTVKCFIGQKIHAVMPAADVLFESAAPLLRNNAIGVVLTGMGNDGAKGMMHLKRHGAKTICQDEKTSVVYGMPKAAYDLGAVDYQLPISDIAARIMRLAREN